MANDERQEMVEAVLNDILSWADDLQRVSPSVPSPGAQALREFVDRIRTALELERESVTKCNGFGNAAACADCMTIDDAISHAEEVANASDTPCARQHRQLADWLKELRDVKSRNVGNAAAMREALLRCDAIAQLPEVRNEQSIKDMRNIIAAALAAPARNCDMFSGDYMMLNTAWFDWTGSPSGHLPDGTAKMTFAAWLLAPAAERKGECDGK